MSLELRQAITNGERETIKFLIDAGVNLNKHFEDGMTPLNYTISLHQEDIARLLLEGGARVTQADSFKVDECKRCPIHYAAACNLFGLVQHLISVGSSVTELDYGHSTALHHAAHNGNIDIVEYLIEIGSAIDHQSKSGRTAIWKAAQNGQEDVVHYLLTCGASVNLQNKVGATMIYDCVKNDQLNLISELINFGIDLNLRDIEGNTVLHFASSVGKVEAIEMLLLTGNLDINAGNEYGNTALHNSALHNYADATLCLLNFGANARILNRNGHSCLYLTMIRRHFECTMLLHDFGAHLTEREMKMYKQFETMSRDDRDTFYFWVLDYFNQPKKLSMLCVQTIRKAIKHPILAYVKGLKLPKPLQQQVLMSNYRNTRFYNIES